MSPLGLVPPGGTNFFLSNERNLLDPRGLLLFQPEAEK